MLTKRAQILFEPETWQILQQVATAKNISTSELIRQTLEKTHKAGPASNKALQAHKTILKTRISSKNIDYKALIEHGRKY
jgi:hypothetical protein